LAHATRNVTRSTGTGFLVCGSGVIATNLHVVKGARTLSVTFPDGPRTYQAEVLRTDEKNDVALLKLKPRPGEPPPPTARFDYARFDRAALGQSVRTIGYPMIDDLGSSPKFATGNITSLQGRAEQTGTFFVSIPIQPGNSGGPVFDETGALVGIVVARANDSYFLKREGIVLQNINLAIKADVLAPLTQALGDRTAWPRSRPRKSVRRCRTSAASRAWSA